MPAEVDAASLAWLRRAAGTLLRCPSDAEEIAQRVLIAAWRRGGAVGRGWMWRALKIEARTMARERSEEREILQAWRYAYSPVGAVYSSRVRLEDAPAGFEMVWGGPRDAGRGQQVQDLSRRGTVCRNGHERNGENTRYARDGTVVCLACRRVRTR